MTPKRYILTSLAVAALGMAFASGSGAVHGDELDFAMGKALFERIWTPAPASTDATDGLGPLFNARSCTACHPNGKRGVFTEDAGGRIGGAGLVVRFGSESGGKDPVYGMQLQTMAVQGLQHEGFARRLPGGGVEATGLMYGLPDPETRMAGRLAPDLHGLGLLQRIPDEDILSWADEDDANHDGVSGRANLTYDIDGEPKIGRFGWKAGKASILMQSAEAVSTDVGLSNPVYPQHSGDCTEAQLQCLNAPHGDSPHFEDLEIDTQMLHLIATFVASLPPNPATTDTTGLKLFEHTGCAACHRPTYTLADMGDIAPFTDLLLHDMGNDLVDGIGDASATGREWRTAPLWGLKQAERFLHDGRATSIRDAIELHGGEASGARDAFTTMTVADQERLLAFLNTL